MMQQTSAGGGGSWSTMEDRPQAVAPKPEELHTKKKGKKERERKQDGARSRGTRPLLMLVFGSRGFLCGTHVRPNYRTQAARSEATANQKTCSPVGWVARFVRVLIIRHAVSLQQRLTFCLSSNNYIRQIYDCVIFPWFPNAHVRSPRAAVFSLRFNRGKQQTDFQRQSFPFAQHKQDPAVGGGSTTPARVTSLSHDTPLTHSLTPDAFPAEVCFIPLGCLILVVHLVGFVL